MQYLRGDEAYIDRAEIKNTQGSINTLSLSIYEWSQSTLEHDFHASL